MSPGYGGHITHDGVRYEFPTYGPGGGCLPQGSCAVLFITIRGLRGDPLPCDFCLGVNYAYPVTATGHVDLPTGEVLPFFGEGRAEETFGRAGGQYWQGTFTEPIAAPEPTTVMLLAGGLGVLVLMKRRTAVC